MKNNKVLDIIIEFTKAAKRKNPKDRKIIFDSGEKFYKICGAGYLLGQIIRQYDIPLENYYISEAAEKKWQELSDKNIWDFTYRDTVLCTSKNPVSVKQYIGSNKEPLKDENTNFLNGGQKFIFRNIFHDEHIIPIKIIIQELFGLEELSYDKVEEVLNKICVCRILKEEDRKISRTANRYFDFEQTYHNVYKSNNIILKNRLGTQKEV